MKVGKCEECGELGGIHVHHKDLDHDNDSEENKQVLCPGCHRQRYVPSILERNRAQERASPHYGIDQSKPGWSEGMSWQELMDARQYPSINVANL